MSNVFPQEVTPLDSLFNQDSLTLGQRLLLTPIKTWQHFSYESSALNCQFEKSCSNFMVTAILEKGVLPGMVIGTDRIVRCNSAARHYHVQLPNARIQYDGRLVDPLAWVRDPKPGKNPLLATSLSIVPGLGRAYAGHPVDGLFSFILVAGFAYNTYNHNQAENPIMTGINASFMTLFWLADFYGAYRTAKMTPPKNIQP
ncbi:MAG: membrane protein insertion efficiency factor YidD [FCB group bacterium]|nr:membrane protein insertion efficiency factor YidD [FCB group bacterium]MBL7029312.1 membrane protein insertion efficiency factor YidD [Candidatus Neomarinimicrobiota bacterium]MBL7122634.1 membrane protein insertion efficiency factor YidD [Candidatus Neomarinimicrobiota bacterium]